MHRLRLVLPLAATLLVAGLVPLPAFATGATRYVDGKTGRDTNSGQSPSQAFKTIARAAASIPKGSAGAGWTVVVVGYTDYVYRERPIPTDFSSAGTSAAPIVFRAAGYAAGSLARYTKPIVSGADVAPSPGEAWTATSTAGVWRTPWQTAPYWYGVEKGSLKSALFQDIRTWLWEQTSLSALASQATKGLGGYWYDAAGKWLYASAVGAAGTAAQNPANHTVDVIMRPAFYFKGDQGVRYVQVRGFEVRHSANGIAFVKGTDYSTAADNVLNGNLLMGIATSGRQTPSGPDPAIGIVVGRNRGSWNTFQLIKVDEGTQNSTFCDNATSYNGLRGMIVQGPPGGTGYTGTTSGITVCRNSFHHNAYNPTGSVYNNASGITIANGARNVTVDRNQLYNNDVGIHVTQERSGLPLIDGIVLSRNNVHDNRRFGLNLYDGTYGNGSGALRSAYDLYWANGVGVMVGAGSTNKTMSHATIHANLGDGVRVGVYQKPLASISITTSLLTSNGGYGVWLVTGHKATLTYTGISGNALGGVKGAPSQSANNTKAPGYLSTTPGTSTHLKIGTGSAQYTAGPGKTPIGARY